MRRPVALFVGLRYLRSQSANQFASFVSLASAIGVGLGVAALILVLSVMNGFENELRGRLTGLTGHATVTGPDGFTDWATARASLLRWPGVTTANPIIELEAVIGNGPELAGVVVTGVQPDLEGPQSPLARGMRAGSLADLRPGGQQLALGAALADRLGVHMGDTVTIIAPRKDPRTGLQTRLRQFTVAGIFEFGVKDHDGGRVITHLADAALLRGSPDAVDGLRITTADIFAAPAIIRAWAKTYGGAHGVQPQVRDWTEDHATYFRAVHLEKVMMVILLSLIVAVAAFNIVATLVMVVTDKRPGIAILRTLGYGRADILRIFAVQGLLIGWLGVLGGVAAGAALALHIDTVAPAVERLFGFQFMPSDVYYLTSLPADLHGSDVILVAVIALVLTAAATVYPAFRAAAVPPAEVLRYE